MQALWLENQKLSLRNDIPIPEPNKGEALIRINKAGICSTDLELLKGYYPFKGIPGHEFVGTVEGSKDDPTWVGARVVGEINISCQVCPTCRKGLITHCPQRKVLGIMGKDGVFSEYITMPIRNLYRIPDAIPDEAAIFVEPLAAALEILEQIHIQPSERVLVVGAGRLGQLISQVLALTGCDLRVVTRYPYQNEILTGREIRSIAESGVAAAEWDFVIEATGSPSGFQLARMAVRPRGTVILKSTYAGDLKLDISSIVVDEITFIGSRCGPFKPALDLLERGLVDPRPLITAKFPLHKGPDAVKRAGHPGEIKVILEC
jgi:threonine dehydrogenase-like Zn-dependent dehydrogenase